MTARRLREVLALGTLAVLGACTDGTGPVGWPVAIQLRLVNATQDLVFIKAVGDESLYPGVARLAPNDSACTSVYAWADPVLVEVHSVSDPGIVYGSAPIHPLAARWQAVVTTTGWHAVVTTSGVTAVRSATCS